MTEHLDMLRLMISERDIKALCGTQVFRRAEDYLRLGAVLNPRYVNGALKAKVQGSEDQPYDVTVAIKGKQLRAQCTCPYDFAYCKHVGAVLLTWSRHPDRFQRGASDASMVETHGDPPMSESRKEPSDEVASLLSLRTIKDLREIGRRRGINLRGTSKEELLRQLLAVLLDPAEIQRFASSLGTPELACLEALYVLREGRLVAAAEVQSSVGYVLPSSKEDIPRLLEQLRDAGIIFSGASGGYDQDRYCVPGIVVSHLPKSVLMSAARKTKRAVLPQPARARHAADDVLYLLCGYLSRNKVEKRPVEPTSLIERSEFLRGWRNMGEEVALLEKMGTGWEWREKLLLTVLPTLPLMGDADLKNLRDLTGLEPAALDFFLHVLRTLELVKGKDRFAVQDGQVPHFLSVPSVWRRRAIADAWLRLTGWNELMEMMRKRSDLRLRRRAGYMAHLNAQDFNDRLARGRRLVARLLALLPERVWLPMSAVIEAVRLISWDSFAAPSVVAQGYEPAWWLESKDGRRLDARVDSDWASGNGAAVMEMIRGPLAWMGVATIGKAGAETMFRLDGLRWLLGLEQPPVEPPRPLTVSEDLLVNVPSNCQGGLTVHDVLHRIAEPLEASPQGIRYRLTAKAACDAFTAGIDADGIVSFLEDRSGSVLPAPVRNTLQDWWQRYGAIRLYPGLALLEFADDYTLPELLAGTSLPNHLVYRFSSRAIAIDPMTVDDLVKELQLKGYTPKLATGAK